MTYDDLSGTVRSGLRAALDRIAEADRRYREDMRLRGISDETFRRIGLSRGHVASALRAPRAVWMTDL